MHSSEAEILSQIRRVQADLFPGLPAEIEMTAQDTAAIQIKIYLLQARLELGPEEEQTPLPLTQLLALLVELVGHSAELSQLLTDAVPDPSLPSHTAFMQALRGAVLSGEMPALRSILEQHRQRTTTVISALESHAVSVDSMKHPPA